VCNGKCPDCGTKLDFHHETYETVVYSCSKCNHLIAERKNTPPYEYVDKKNNICPYIIDHINGVDLTGNDLGFICDLLNDNQKEINNLKKEILKKNIKEIQR
jgi:hypothetical protein